MKKAAFVGLGLCVLSLGCTPSETVSDGSGSASDSGGIRYLATTEPENAIPVGTARENVVDGQEVSLVGVIGGSSEPFVDGLAAFTIVDPKVPYCAPEEGCPTPWDYCCTQDQVKDNVATVKLVDPSGAPVAKSARELLGVKELATVVVSGIAKRDDEGNLSIAADKVFVRPN